tara:strand:+ start:725 stop:856 length:132 start_codon:yes stop_codon:yes gene_type:complete
MARLADRGTFARLEKGQKKETKIARLEKGVPKQWENVFFLYLV